MANKSSYFNLAIRSIALSMTSLLIGYLIFGTGQYPLAGLVILAFIIQTFLLIDSINKTNKKVAYFFDAVRNDDSTLHFSEDTGNSTERFLNKSLNKVNRLIQVIKTEQISQEQYYSYILEKSNTGFLTFEKSGHILLTNNAAKQLLGYNHLTHIDQLSRINEKLFLTFTALMAGENKVVKFNNEKEVVQLSLKASSITIRNEELTLVAINNIRSELEEQEVESWIRLIRVLTHEIMNSVAPITSLAETLSEFYEERDETNPELDKEIIENTVRGLDIIKQRGQGLITFVDSYRKLTKVSIPNKKAFDARQFLEKIRILVSQEPNFNKVKFTINVASDVSNLSADEGQLTQVMINLSKNALQAMGDTVDGQVTISAFKDNDRNVITVKDDGTGISQEVMEQIFIPFFTTKEQGTGIGLSLSHHIMRIHGGSLQVSSELGNGAEFKLVF